MSTVIAFRRTAASSISARHLSAVHPYVTRRHATSSTKEEEADPQLNGYPQLPFVSRQTLPAFGWQDPLMRRNFGDTVHEEDEVLSMWGPDVPPLPPATAAKHFLIAVSAFIGFGFLVKNVLLQDPPAVRRSYPFAGLATELGGAEDNQARPETVDKE